MPLRKPPSLRARVVLGRVFMSGAAWMGVMTSTGSVCAEGQAPPLLAIRAITMTAGQPALVITIEATGALPMPSSGVAQGPPRIFFDFPGVALKAPVVTPSSDPRLRRVRAGVHSARPLVTRVVLDLVALQPYRLEQGPDGVRVIVGATQGQLSTGIAPVPSLPDPRPPAPHEPVRPPAREPVVTPPAAVREPAPPMIAPPTSAPTASTPVPGPAVTAPAPPPERSPARPSSPASAPPRVASPLPSPAPPPKDLERYKRQIAPALDRLRLQQPLLASLDGAENQTMDRMQLAVEEFERLKVELAGTKPPDSLRSQHDMLIQSTTLALMATRLRLEAFRTSDPGTLRNAASAAAGATLLLDRVCANLGCPDSGR